MGLGLPSFCMVVCLCMLSGFAASWYSQPPAPRAACILGAFRAILYCSPDGLVALPALVFLVCWGVMPGSVCIMAHQSALHQLVTAQDPVRYGTQIAGHLCRLTKFQSCFGLPLASWLIVCSSSFPFNLLCASLLMPLRADDFCCPCRLDQMMSPQRAPAATLR